MDAVRPLDIPTPDAGAHATARTALDKLIKPVGSLGQLEDLAAWLAAAHGRVPPRPLTDVRVVVFAGDHGIATELGVSAYPKEITAGMVRAFLAGASGVNVLARLSDARVRVVDIGVDDDLEDVPATVRAHKIRRGSGSIDTEDALAPGEAERAFAAGATIADIEIDAGADLLIPGDMGIGNTTVAAALIGGALGLPGAEVAGTGTGVEATAWQHKAQAIDAALARAGDRIEHPLPLLTALGSSCAAATAGFLVRGAARGVPVLLDGVFSCAAAVLAREIAPDAVRWWLAGHRSTEPAQAYALKALGLTPIVDLGMRLGEGSGAVQAVPTLRAARAILAEMGSLADLDVG